MRLCHLWRPIIKGTLRKCLYAAPWSSCQLRKLRVAHALGMPGTFSPPPRISDPDIHHGTCVTHVPWCMPGSLTSILISSRWREKCSRHSRRMRNPQFNVSSKRPIHYNAPLLSRNHGENLQSRQVVFKTYMWNFPVKRTCFGWGTLCLSVLLKINMNGNHPVIVNIIQFEGILPKGPYLPCVSMGPVGRMSSNPVYVNFFKQEQPETATYARDPQVQN